MGVHKYVLPNIWLSSALVGIFKCGAVLSVPPVEPIDGTVYVYLNFKQRWCAVRSVGTFKKLVNSDDASELEADQGQVWFAGDRPARVSEFRMDADGEWSTTATYYLDNTMNVTSVDLIGRSGEPARDKLWHFAVGKRGYEPNPGSGLTAAVFRQAKTFSSFPFASLARRARNLDTKGKLCS